MNYNLKGNIKAYYCGDCYDFFYRGKIKFYLPDQQRETTQALVADAKDTFHQRSEEEMKALEKRLIGETETDDFGNFSFVIRNSDIYKGGAIEVDFDSTSAPLNIPPEKIKVPPHGPIQFHITTIQPLWKQGTENDRETFVAYWEYAIQNKFWCWILRLLGLYVICGKVRDCKGDFNVAGVRVFAYDVDLIQDDSLGFGTTDASGNFKIYYTEADFSKTIFSWLNVEWPAGPDLYFKIEAGDGTILLNENRQRGHDRDRANVSNCFCVNFCVECPKGSLVCALNPIGCVDSAAKLVDGKLLTIIGTASGCGMNRYDLQVLWNGTLDVSAGAIIYANAAGNPDPALTFGTHAGFNEKLGFLDINKVISNAGSNATINTNFVIRLTVHSSNGSVVVCTITFQIDASEVYIKNVGGRVSHDVTNPNEPLRIADTAVAEEGAIGGGATIWGAARVYGCDDEKISNYGLYWKKDDFGTAQPANGSTYDPLTNGWTPIGNVDYDAGFSTFTPDQLRSWNDLTGPNSVISNNGFYTYNQIIEILGMTFNFPEGLVANTGWATGTSGRYSLLLKNTDTIGNTYYDIQRVWVDNFDVTGVITKIGNLAPCTDLYTRDKTGNFKVVDIKGTAWDPYIDNTILTNPSDNFGHYDLFIQKQGSAPEQLVVPNSNQPVPARPALVPSEGVLYSFDLSWINTTVHTLGDNKLLDGEFCSFVFILNVYDKTAVNNSSTVHFKQHLFPVKIINSNEP